MDRNNDTTNKTHKSRFSNQVLELVNVIKNKLLISLICGE